MKKLLQLLLFFGFIQVAVGQQADVVVSVTNNQIVYVPGTELIYTITVSNFGPNTANGVEVISPLPAGITDGYYWEGSNNSSGANSQVFDRIRTLPSGQTVTYSLFIDIPLTYTGPLTVSATANSVGAPALTAPPSPALPAVADPNSNSNSASDTDQQTAADIQLTFTNNSNYYTPGQINSYTATVTNLGPTPALNVTIFCDIPSSIAQTNFTWTGSNGSSGNAVALSNSIASMEVGETVTYTINVAVPADYQGLLQLNTSVFSTSTDNILSNNNVTEYDTRAQGADILVTNTDNSSNYFVGTSSVYTLTIQNLGPEVATNVDVSFPIPVGISTMSWTGNATSGTGSLVDVISSLAVGQSVTYQVTIAVPLDFTGDLVTFSSALGDQTDLNLQCLSCTDINTAGADLVATITNNQTVFVGSSQSTYTAVITNLGPQDATNVQVIQTLTGAAEVVAWNSSTDEAGADLINDTISLLPVGESVTYTIQVATSANASAAITNTIAVSSDVSDPNPNCTGCSDTDTLKTGDIQLSVVNAPTGYISGIVSSGTYTLTVTNNSDVTVFDINLSTVVPTGITAYSWTSSFGTGGNGAINQNIISLGAGETVTYLINYTIGSAANASIVFTASLDVNSIEESNLVNNNANLTIVPINNSDVQIVVANSQSTYTSPSTVTYSIVVRNNGPKAATAIQVNFPVPTGTTITAWSGNASSGSGAVNNTIADLAVGATVTYLVTVQIPAGYSGNLVATGTITSTSIDPQISNNTSSDVDFPSASIADVAVTVTDAVSLFSPGDAVEYQVEVFNNGPQAATNVAVLVLTPLGFGTVTWSGNGTNGINALNDVIASIPVGGSVTYTYTVQTLATSPSVLAVQATVSSSSIDLITTNNTSSDLNQVTVSDVSVSITDGQSIYTTGDTLVYTLVVSNLSAIAASNVLVLFPVPTGAVSVSWVGNSTSGNGAINNTITSLAAYSSVTYTVTVQVDPAFTQTFLASASAISNQGDPNSQNNTDADSNVTSNPQSDVQVQITDSGATYTPGSPTTFDIVVTNNGPQAATNIQVNVPTPTNATTASWSGNSTSGNGNLINTIANLEVGQSLTYTYTIQTSITETADLVVVATVSPQTADSNASNNSISDTNSAFVSDVSVVVDNSQVRYVTNSNTTYTVTVTNNGPLTATNIQVNFPAPTGTSTVSWTGNAASGSSNLSDTIVSLAAGATVIYTVTINVPTAFVSPSLVATATVSSFSSDLNSSNNSNSDVDLRNLGFADVEVSIVDNRTFYSPNGTVTYTVQVTNNGMQQATGITVNVPLPAGITVGNWSGNGANGNGALNNLISALQVGETIFYTYTITTPVIGVNNIVLNAAVTSESTDNNNLNNVASDTNTPPLADISISVIPPSNPIIGQTCEFVVVVTNNGPQSASSIPVNFTNPVGGTLVRILNVATGAQTTIPGQLNIPVLGAGSSITYIVTALVSANNSGSISYSATVGAPLLGLDSVLGNNSSAASAVTLPAGFTNDISVVIYDFTSNFIPGQPLTYQVTVQNVGLNAVNQVQLASNLPQGITTGSWTGNSTSGTGALNNTITNLAAGQSITYTFTIQVPANFSQTTNLVYTVNVSTATDDNPANNNATDVNIPRPFADLSILKTDNKTTFAETRFVDDKIGDAVPGFTITEFNEYTITVINNGPSDAVNISVIDLLPANPISTNTQIVSSDMTWTGPNGTSGTGTMISNLPVLAAGGVAVYTIKVRIPANYNINTTSNFTNTASVVSDTQDGNISNNISTDVNTPASRFILVENDPIKYSANGQLSGLAEGFVQNVLVRSNCAETSNWQLSSGPNPLNYSVGYFNRRNSDFPIKDGIVLVCGNAMDPNGAAGPNAAIVDGGVWAGDTDFNPGFMVPPVGIPANTTFDAAFLKFNFVPSTDKLKFNFVFASEEYSQNNFECTYSDVFAFILTDLTAGGQPKNLAVIPNTTIPVKVTTIHLPGCDGGQNPQWFGRYNFSPTDANIAANAAINFNGQTRIMQAQGEVIPGHQYSIKLVIANQADSNLASAVFIEGGSFDFEAQVQDPDGLSDLSAAVNPVCNAESRLLSYGDTPFPNASYSWLKNGVKIEGANTYQLEVSESGVYTGVITYTSGCKKSDDIVVDFLSPLPTLEPKDVTLCSLAGSTATFNMEQNAYILNGLNPLNYDISYALDLQSAIDFGPNLINNPTNFQVPVAELPKSIWVKVFDQNSSTACAKYSEIILDAFIPSGSISYNDPTGCADTPTFSQVTMSADLEPGGIFSATPAGLSINPGTGEIDFENSFASTTPYQVIYTVIKGDCPPYVTAPVEVTVGTCCATTVPADFSTCYQEPISIVANSDKPAATFSWEGPDGFTATGSAITDNRILSPGEYTYTATASVNGIPCDPDSIVVTVLPEVIAQIVPNNFTVCLGSNTAVQFQGLAGATITYNVDGGPDQTAVLDSSGLFEISFTNVTTPFTVNLTKVELITSIVCSLLGTPILDTVTVSTGAPTATIGSPNPVCEGSTGTVLVSATPNTTVNYEYQNLFSTQNGSVTIDSSGQGIISLFNLTSNTTVNLLSVATSDTPPCTATITGQSAVIVVNPTPVVTQFPASNNNVCAGDPFNLLISGTANATVTLSDGTSSTPVLLDAAG
ncbi:choice-of-anchor L domain-containing protein, partial [Flavobacterium sp.]|uniref:choice-of-anchor L domain-containing protein n=1 Tax=Flavobacterium sp. TaxID=239 RepID=UPI0026316638